jgi:hypothetical protein
MTEFGGNRFLMRIANTFNKIFHNFELTYTNY